MSSRLMRRSTTSTRCTRSTSAMVATSTSRSAFAPVFSIWTTIEECLNPPHLGERRPAHDEPFSGPEPFLFRRAWPGRVRRCRARGGPLVPRWIECRATFKYALGDDFIDKLKTIHALGMDRTDSVSVKGVEVAPRDVLAGDHPGSDQPGRQVPRARGRRHRSRASRTATPRDLRLPDVRRRGDWRKTRPPGRRLADRFNPTIAMELLATAPGAAPASSVRRPLTRSVPRPPRLHGIHHADVEMEPGALGRPERIRTDRPILEGDSDEESDR